MLVPSMVNNKSGEQRLNQDQCIWKGVGQVKEK